MYCHNKSIVIAIVTYLLTETAFYRTAQSGKCQTTSAGCIEKVIIGAGRKRNRCGFKSVSKATNVATMFDATEASNFGAVTLK